MQVLLNTDPHIDGRESMHEYLELVVVEVLGQFGDRITHIEAHLSGADGVSQAGRGDVHCSLEARLVEHEPVVARHHADTAQQALHGALRKLSCVLGSEFEKQDHRYVSPEPVVSENAQTEPSPCCCSTAQAASTRQP